jgi:hypothetical protein
MSGPGRPTKQVVNQRKRQILVFLVASAAASEDAVKRIASKLQLQEGSVRAYLESMRGEVERDQIPSDDLANAIKTADSFKALRALAKQVQLGIAARTIDPTAGSSHLEAIREQRQLLRAERQEQAQAVLQNLEPMTMDEVERFEAWREARAIRPLAPGEAALPPPETPPASPPPAGHASAS